ncbi:MAG TPA: hypothetical protein VNM40_02580 [Candidatus Paceibacterota bacterium]|nr:hypothetical protein [Candidatus Paceibacterota bacterium]
MAKVRYAPTWRGIQPLIFAHLRFLIWAAKDEKFIGEFFAWLRTIAQLKSMVAADCGWDESYDRLPLQWPDRELTDEEKKRVLSEYRFDESWYANRIVETLEGREPQEESEWDAGREAEHGEWWKKYIAPDARDTDNI